MKTKRMPMTKGIFLFSILFCPEMKTNKAAKANIEWLIALIKER